ncbi:MAG TPA: hypothetical protein VN453_04230 [Feifaniaceae bacterium]|nr:hypothetical protein [Feifaniaceae bacterium]
MRVLTLIGSVCTACFGVWHFFVPKAWNWYAYIAPEATELVAAVRAINVFFSLSLVLFAAVDMLIVFGAKNRYASVVLLTATAVLWAVRCAMQVIYPQGSVNPALQYGMFAAFLLIFACFASAALLAAFGKQSWLA